MVSLNDSSLDIEDIKIPLSCHVPKALPSSLTYFPSSGIDAALQWNNGRTYFFKKGQYWRFNDRQFTIDKVNPAFPRAASEWWFGCPKLGGLEQGARVGGLTSLVEQSGVRRASFVAAMGEDGQDEGDEHLDAHTSDEQQTDDNSV